MRHLIVLSSTTLGDRYSASAPTFWKTVNGYARANWRVHILNAALGTSSVGTEDYGDGVTVREAPAPFRRLTKVRFLGRLFSVAQHRRVAAWQTRQGEELIGTLGLSAADTVLYACDSPCVLAGKRLRDRTGIPLVTRLFGLWDMYKYPDTFRNRLRLYPKFQACETRAELMIVTDDGTRGEEVIRRLGNDSPICFWRNGVDVPARSEELPPALARLPREGKWLVTLSRFHPGKRVDRSIRALARVRESHPDVRLLVCGYGAQQPELEALAEALGLGSAVVFTGRIPHEQVFDYLRRGDIFLSFYTASNLGNPLFEAMRCGLPIITSDAGDTRRVITHGENGLLLPEEGLDEAIPAAVCRLLEDPALAERLGANAREYARAHLMTWDERIALETAEVEKLLRKP